VDEFGFATEDILPQDGEHWDVGVKFLFGKHVGIDLTWFYVRIEDEIWFDAFNYINTNYEHPTKRKGLETAFRIYPLDTIRLWGSYTYTDASFEGIDYEVPTVPKHKFVAGLNWEMVDWLELGVTYNYVGSRPQGGEPIAGERYEYMPSYDVWDVKLTGRLDKYHLMIFFAVNNIFDEQYYTLSFYDNVYPSPERNYRVGVEWFF
jgi:outer membrane receptor protein involved in Fe transport